MKIDFESGDQITHMAFIRGRQTFVKNSVKDHLEAKPGDWLIIRAMGNGAVMIEKLEQSDVDLVAELEILSKKKKGGPEGPGEI